jgi:hypothetical protein
VPGVLVDPAAYGSQAGHDSEPLFDYDEWLRRQQAAGVPLILTDTPRIPNDDRSSLRKALARWASIDDPTLVVLPIEPWWLSNNMASAERLARRIFADADPRDGWREACQAGAQASASLLEGRISLPRSRWLRQWLDLGSPSHYSQADR